MPRNKRKNLARAIEHRAEKNADIRLGNSVAAALLGSQRVAKALTLIDGPAAPRQAQEDCGATKQERRNHSIFYKDTNPFGNKIHATQKMRGKSIPLV